MTNYQPITSSLSYLNPVCVIIALAVLNGCVALQPFPMAGQAGDTITLAVGSADGMNSSNTTVEFFPFGTNPNTDPGIPVPVREIVKMYPDKTSHAWLGGDPKENSEEVITRRLVKCCGGGFARHSSNRKRSNKSFNYGQSIRAFLRHQMGLIYLLRYCLEWGGLIRSIIQ